MVFRFFWIVYKKRKKKDFSLSLLALTFFFCFFVGSILALDVQVCVSARVCERMEEPQSNRALVPALANVYAVLIVATIGMRKSKQKIKKKTHAEKKKSFLLLFLRSLCSRRYRHKATRRKQHHKPDIRGKRCEKKKKDKISSKCNATATIVATSTVIPAAVTRQKNNFFNNTDKQGRTLQVE